jgi:DNA-binding GntR family transcriptional regulator
MSTIGEPGTQTLRVRSVVGLAYDAIREQIVDGSLAPGARVGQAELADQLGISRGSVREALRRLAGDGLVEFEVNRGFFVADFGLEVVLERLEARLLLEPQIARLAAGRRTEADLAALRDAIDSERAAATSDAAHDASRAFHLALAAATANEQLWRLIDGLWIADVGRRLLARRYTAPTWQADDAREHEEILAAIEASDGDAAEALVRRHDEDALRHWSDQQHPEAGS